MKAEESYDESSIGELYVTKAVDWMWNATLLAKILSYAKLCQWTYNFISGRGKLVLVDGSQVSAIASTLFLTHINDLILPRDNVIRSSSN